MAFGRPTLKSHCHSYSRTSQVSSLKVSLTSAVGHGRLHSQQVMFLGDIAKRSKVLRHVETKDSSGVDVHAVANEREMNRRMQQADVDAW